MSKAIKMPDGWIITEVRHESGAVVQRGAKDWWMESGWSGRVQMTIGAGWGNEFAEVPEGMWRAYLAEAETEMAVPEAPRVATWPGQYEWDPRGVYSDEDRQRVVAALSAIEKSDRGDLQGIAELAAHMLNIPWENREIEPGKHWWISKYRSVTEECEIPSDLRALLTAWAAEWKDGGHL